MLGIISAGVAPALALMSFIYLKDRITEPIPLIMRTFVFGCLLVFPIMFIQYAFISDEIGNAFVQSFFVVAFLEEFFKWFIFMYVIYQHTEFDAHYDGIVYAVAISLGFATVENILYLFVNGIEYALSRAIFPVSSHALFGVIMGYYFGKAKMNANHRIRSIVLALILPIVLHGIYNFILITFETNWIFYVVPFMILLWMFGLRRMKMAIASY
ncbi:glutamic-type intramembrane protease PrsW [Ornithinibacillus halotolerans]|uniref:Protease PrsW n=1 Tax=Ornithinibacillus halotolerans TaxID=1274357 RepID=A0A916W217_9BACI|nr:glutamic-type intramembrane protease PrsW [Ornithinibacillus halotolerans]GGA61137.1 protease PrsW [Ornithinibacillus halotolerans]